MRAHRESGGDLLASGWLPPRAAAETLGITERQLYKRAERGEIKRRALVPGIWLYEVLVS